MKEKHEIKTNFFHVLTQLRRRENIVSWIDAPWLPLATCLILFVVFKWVKVGNYPPNLVGFFCFPLESQSSPGRELHSVNIDVHFTNAITVTNIF